MIGDEFKTARQHLLKHLEGNIAWKDPAQAQRQKERLAAKQAAALESLAPSAVPPEPREEILEGQTGAPEMQL